MHRDPSPRFRITATAKGGTVSVVVRSPASRSFAPDAVAKAMNRAATTGRRALARKGIKGATVTAVDCLD